MNKKNDNKNETYMPDSILPKEYNRIANSTHRLSRLDIQRAMTDIKRFVEARLESDLNLVKHAAPMAFQTGTGVNDELDGTESKSSVKFTVPNQDIARGIKMTKEQQAKLTSPYEMQCEVVQSLAKWKRIMLTRLGCEVGTGIYCDSTSIRKGYKGDVTHSVIADQWDFEVHITKEQRTVEQLKYFVKTIWKIVTDAEDMILQEYPEILLEGHPTASWRLPKEITFITSEELHAMFPDMDIHERENAAVINFGAIFIIGMGWPMKDGSAPEEVRSPGYDDWNLNGDVICYNPLTEYRHEISSMGIRVDKNSLIAQLEHRGVGHERNLDFMKAVINEDVVFSYGGGLGISRLLMLLLRTGHIGEVQVGLWHDAHYKQAKEVGVDLIPDRIVHLAQ
ncbi:aspartate--ammonia ligase [Chaetoceros tenuissimus]|uniref:Aspartate--ammonia ligase n=1 Tax=Chaetoceros tenuissimus TaxID=426638 RepID=A0AAD3HAT6_9STRA|nr:aspartate--ammonia ligase [Chaetoceros tenuissimus]